jgi:hypothetical protein
MGRERRRRAVTLKFIPKAGQVPHQTFELQGLAVDDLVEALNRCRLGVTLKYLKADHDGAQGVPEIVGQLPEFPGLPRLCLVALKVRHRGPASLDI